MIHVFVYGFVAALGAASCAPRAADDCDVHTWQSPDEANRGPHVFFGGRVAYDTIASSVGGTVVDARAGKPLAGVVIFLNATGRTERDTTNAAGRFFLMRDGMPTRVELRAVHSGYRCVAVEELHFGGGLDIDLHLSPL